MRLVASEPPPCSGISDARRCYYEQGVVPSQVRGRMRARSSLLSIIRYGELELSATARLMREHLFLLQYLLLFSGHSFITYLITIASVYLSYPEPYLYASYRGDDSSCDSSLSDLIGIVLYLVTSQRATWTPKQGKGILS
jgi:hypothetical protein